MRDQLASASLAVLLIAACGSEEEIVPSEEERLAQAPNIELGERRFRQCAPCHNRAPDAGHRVGPNLWGISGQDAGRFPDFSYSRAMQRSELVWDDATIDAYITDPQGLIPGNRMAYNGMPSEADRRDLIAYLATLQD